MVNYLQALRYPTKPEQNMLEIRLEIEVSVRYDTVSSGERLQNLGRHYILPKRQKLPNDTE